MDCSQGKGRRPVEFGAGGAFFFFNQLPRVHFSAAWLLPFLLSQLATSGTLPARWHGAQASATAEGSQGLFSKPESDVMFPLLKSPLHFQVETCLLPSALSRKLLGCFMSSRSLKN